MKEGMTMTLPKQPLEYAAGSVVSRKTSWAYVVIAVISLGLQFAVFQVMDAIQPQSLGAILGWTGASIAFALCAVAFACLGYRHAKRSQAPGVRWVALAVIPVAGIFALVSAASVSEVVITAFRRH